jgi:hypothetical protein
MGGVGGYPPKYSMIKVKYKKFGGKPPTPPIPSNSLPYPPSFILYLNNPLLATFYTLLFLDYIHEAPPTTLLTYINLLNLQYI